MIKEGELVGSWTSLGKYTPDRFEEPTGLEFATEIEIKSKGVCLVKWQNGTTVTGDWVLRHNEMGPNSETEKNILQMRIMDGVMTEFSISIEHKRLHLWRYIGDPDSREFMEFEK